MVAEGSYNPPTSCFFCTILLPIIKDQLKKAFTSTLTNIDNKTKVDKTDAKPKRKWGILYIKKLELQKTK